MIVSSIRDEQSTIATCSGTELTDSLVLWLFQVSEMSSRPPRPTLARGRLTLANRGAFSDKICISQFPQSRCVIGSQGSELSLWPPPLIGCTQPAPPLYRLTTALHATHEEIFQGGETIQGAALDCLRRIKFPKAGPKHFDSFLIH